MNIIIPIGGTGNRFHSDYPIPKPLILVDGEPMVVTVMKNLKISTDDDVYIAYQESLNEYDFQNVVKKSFPTLNINFVVLYGPTIGAPDTLKRVLLTMDKDNLDRPTVSFDVDTIYTEDVLDILRKKARHENAILYFVTDENAPIYSYVSLRHNIVTNIKEKIRISNFACSGAYKFQTGTLLLKHIHSMYKEQKTSKEKYTSAVYSRLLKSNIPVYGYEISGINCVGTP